MFTVAAPTETLASALKMTRAAEGYAVNVAWVPGAFEFVRIHGLGISPLFVSAASRSRFLT
jgi:hypothetical protein